MSRAMAARLAFAIATALSIAAAAQSAPSARVRAAARFKQGQEFFKVGDYEHAIAEYEAAYQLSKEPLLIFNIALCHDRANRSEEALAAFLRYLDLAPAGEVADEAREDVVRLTKTVDAIRAKRDAEAAAQEQRARQQRDEAARAAAERAQHEQDQRAARRTAMVELEAQLAQRAQIERWSAWAAGAVGIVALGGGALYGFEARSDAAAITNHNGPWTDAELARDAEGQRAGTRMIVLTSVGGAALIGSGALYLLGRSHDATALQLRLELQTAASGGVVGLAGRF